MWPLVVVGIVLVVGAARRRARRRARRAGVPRWRCAATVGSSRGRRTSGRTTHDTMRLYYGTDTRAPRSSPAPRSAAWWAWRGPVRSRIGRVALGGRGRRPRSSSSPWRGPAVDGAWLYRGGSSLCALAAARGPRRRVASASAARSRGRWSVDRSSRSVVISYGIYLWHWPIFVVLDPGRTGLDGWRLFMVRCAATLAVAIASYVLVERPIRSNARCRCAAASAHARWWRPASSSVSSARRPAPPPRAHPTPDRRARRSDQAADATRSTPRACWWSVTRSRARRHRRHVAAERPSRAPRWSTTASTRATSHRPLWSEMRTPTSRRSRSTAPRTGTWSSAAFRPDIAILVLGDVHEQRYLYGEPLAVGV